MCVHHRHPSLSISVALLGTRLGNRSVLSLLHATIPSLGLSSYDVRIIARNLTLTIGQYCYTRNEGRFTDEAVCRDIMGALVLLMNLQLENFNNKKNESSDSSMFCIKKNTINQAISVSLFGRVNKSFCQFALDFISMLLVFDTWSSHVSQTVRRMILP